MIRTANAAALRAYNQVAVQSGAWRSAPHRLIQLLMDSVLEKIAAARDLIKNDRRLRASQQISTATAIVEGLRSSLDLEQGGDIAANLDSLYAYMERRLQESGLQNDIAGLDEVASLMREIKNAWDAIPDDVKYGRPAMTE